MKSNLIRSSQPLILAILFHTSVIAQEWKPIEPSQFEIKAPLVDKDADAEVLLWEVYVNDSSVTTTDFIHLVRVKIFTDRGIESQSRIDIPYMTGTDIKDVTGRTIGPDGTIQELKKDAVFDREIVKFGRFRIKAKSFALPALQVGSIIEYRWREVNKGGANFVRMRFQREIPVQVVRYYLKPYPYARYPMRTMVFQGKPINFVKEKNGYFMAEMTNMPAFREEPHMPPEDQVRAWMLVFYATNTWMSPSGYWKDLGRQLHEAYKNDMKVNNDVRKAAAEITGGVTEPEARIERLFNFCRTKIRNVNDDESDLTADGVGKVKENKSPADTLKRGYGTGRDIDFLFGALATAAGFDARYASLSDRSRKFFDLSYTSPYFLNAYNIAVRIGDGWKFFDPATTHVPYGMLRWQEEGVDALISDANDPIWVKTPLSPAEKSREKRIANLILDEEGNLSGDVRLEYTGHLAVEMKEDLDDQTAEQREEKLRSAVKKRLSGADVTDIKIEGVTDGDGPLSYTCRIRIPGYAERTGKRLFLQPAYFQKGISPLFQSSARTHDIYFHYAWSEDDEVTIKLPPGYALDNAESPISFGLGEFGSYQVTLGITVDKTTLVYTRKLKFSGLIFPKSIYSNLKDAFDQIHRQDNHIVTLKDASAASK